MVAEAVREAESRTSAEIVPVVATASGTYDRAEDIVGLIAGLGSMVLAWLFWQREDPGAGAWDSLGLRLPLWSLVAIVIIGFVAGATAAARIAWLRRLVVPEALRAREVGSGSARIFHDRRIHHTRAASGVLLYVSLLERRAVVLADRGAFEALGQDSIDDVCRGLTEDLRRGDVPAALCASVRRLGELLGKKLPRGSADRNELADALITID